MKKAPIAFAAITGIALITALTAQGAYVISQPNTNGAFGSGATGQSFTPSVGMVDNPGPSTTTIDLTGISFWSNATSSFSVGGSAADLDHVYLHIYDNNPAGSSNLVGVSTNFLDLNPVYAVGTEMAWTFNSLTLNYNTTYYAVFSKGTTATNIDDVGIGIQTQTGDPYSGGVGLTNNFVASSTVDAKFKATFTNPVPEPSTLAVFATGLVLLGARRRRA